MRAFRARIPSSGSTCSRCREGRTPREVSWTTISIRRLAPSLLSEAAFRTKRGGAPKRKKRGRFQEEVGASAIPPSALGTFETLPQSHRPNPSPSGRHACPPEHAPAPTHDCVAPGTHEALADDGGTDPATFR